MTHLLVKDLEEISTELLWKRDDERLVPIGFNILYAGMPMYTIEIDDEDLLRIISSRDEWNELNLVCGHWFEFYHSSFYFNYQMDNGIMEFLFGIVFTVIVGYFILMIFY